jgi:hypothetical protein
VAATRGRAVFGRNCIGCHVGATSTDNNGGKLHAPSETGVDGGYAARHHEQGLSHHACCVASGSTRHISTTAANRPSPMSSVTTTGSATCIWMQLQQHDLVEYLKVALRTWCTGERRDRPVVLIRAVPAGMGGIATHQDTPPFDDGPRVVRIVPAARTR